MSVFFFFRFELPGSPAGHVIWSTRSIKSTQRYQSESAHANKVCNLWLMCVIFVVERVTGYVPCAARFLFRRCATSTLLLKCCVFQYWHHILQTCLKPGWLRGQIQILKLEIFYYSGQGTSCSQTGILQPSCENKSSNKWFILASYSEWGLYF